MRVVRVACHVVSCRVVCAGVYSFPEDAHATQDGNEMTGPTLPQLRALDALGTPRLPSVHVKLAADVTRFID